MQLKLFLKSELLSYVMADFGAIFNVVIKVLASKSSRNYGII